MSATFTSPDRSILDYDLVLTNRRITLDITYQHPATRYMGVDDGPYFRFVASNGYEVISRSRMDIQTERVWLLGAKDNERSGSMVFSDNVKRDEAAAQFQIAIAEWIENARVTIGQGLAPTAVKSFDESQIEELVDRASCATMQVFEGHEPLNLKEVVEYMGQMVLLEARQA